jgi:hypothetical protein
MLQRVRQRRAGLAALLKALRKVQLLEHSALQPYAWLGHVHALEQRQQQQEDGQAQQ